MAPRAWKEVFLLPATQLRLPLRQPCGSCGPRGSKAMPAPASGGCSCWVHLGDFPGSCVFLVCILNLPGGLNPCYLWEGFLPESPFQQRFTCLRPGVFWLLLPSVAFFPSFTFSLPSHTGVPLMGQPRTRPHCTGSVLSRARCLAVLSGPLVGLCFFMLCDNLCLFSGALGLLPSCALKTRGLR